MHILVHFYTCTMTNTHAHMTTNPTFRSLSDTRAPMFVNMCMSSSVHTRLHNTCTQKHAHESLHIIMAARMRTHTHTRLQSTCAQNHARESLHNSIAAHVRTHSHTDAIALRRAWTHTHTHMQTLTRKHICVESCAPCVLQS